MNMPEEKPDPEPEPSLRFYPDSIPRFCHEPTRDRFLINGDDRYGEGVVSLTSFSRGEIVFGFTGFFSAEVTQFSLQIRDGLHLHDPFFYGKILHSCSPNARVDLKRRVFVATRRILPGQHVTMDYAQTEDYLFKTFDCQCGAQSCRGYIAGRKQAPEPNMVREHVHSSEAHTQLR